MSESLARWTGLKDRAAGYAGYGWIWQDMQDMAGYGWIRVGMAGYAGYGWIWLDMQDMAGYGWIWLDMAGYGWPPHTVLGSDTVAGASGPRDPLRRMFSQRRAQGWARHSRLRPVLQRRAGLGAVLRRWAGRGLEALGLCSVLSLRTMECDYGTVTLGLENVFAVSGTATALGAVLSLRYITYHGM
jgi:hypothetical protein